MLASVVATDGESAELTLLSPNEKQYNNVAGATLDFLQGKAADYGTDDISGWRMITLAEAQLLQAVHTALGIADNRYYLIEDEGTVKQILMSNGTVEPPSAAVAYLRPVVTVTVNNE